MKNIIILSLALLMFSCCDKTKENCKTMNNTTMEDLLTRRSVRSAPTKCLRWRSSKKSARPAPTPLQE